MCVHVDGRVSRRSGGERLGWRAYVLPPSLQLAPGWLGSYVDDRIN